MKKQTLYALEALKVIEGQMGLPDIENKVKTKHLYFLSKVLQQLVRAGILESTKGPGGGFKISNKGLNTKIRKVYNIYGEDTKHPYKPLDVELQNFLFLTIKDYREGHS